MKKYLAITILFIFLLAAGAGGCGAPGRTMPEKEAQEQPPELVLFDKNSERHSFDDPIAREIMRRTGVSIRVMDSTDDPEKREKLMFTYQDYPDLIKVELGAITKYRDAGYLVDLNPYLPQLPAVTEMYGDMLSRMRDQDGSLYYLGNWYGKDPDAIFGFQIRYDYLTELVGRERADSDEPFTQTEFVELLRAFSQKYPEIDGEPSIPFTTCLDIACQPAIQGMYGIKKYYEQDGQLSHPARDPNYLQMIAFENSLYREGLLDKEWVVNRRSLYQDKLTSGRVFATACAYWDIASENAALRARYGDEAFFACYKVLGEGVDASQTSYGGRNSIGWDAIAVTDHCADMEAALKVINFLASEEGQYLMLWGIQGQDWDFVDNVRTPSPENLALFTQDITQAVQKTGIRRWLWFIKNGNGSDGSPYDMMTKYNPTPEASLANRRMAGDYWDESQYMELDPPEGSEESLMLYHIDSIYEKTYLRMINADSPKTLTELYHKLIRDMEMEGLSRVEALWIRNYQQRMKQWRD